MTKKENAGLTYVKEFTFPSEQGFTGSAGAQPVKGYMRGGHVKKAKQPKMPKTVKAEGGSVHDEMIAAGGEMGYKKGGRVKDTSGEFDMTSGPQDSMDTGVQPKRKGRNQASIEAGGTKRVKPKFKKGGKVAPPSVGHLGGGAAAQGARAIREREERTRSTVDEAVKDARKSMRAGTTTHDKAPKAVKATRKPAPGSERGKRKHYGLAFQGSPVVGKPGAGR